MKVPGFLNKLVGRGEHVDANNPGKLELSSAQLDAITKKILAGEKLTKDEQAKINRDAERHEIERDKWAVARYPHLKYDRKTLRAVDKLHTKILTILQRASSGPVDGDTQKRMLAEVKNAFAEAAGTLDGEVVDALYKSMTATIYKHGQRINARLAETKDRFQPS